MGGADSLQAKVVEFMGRPEAYAPPPATVERIETHASIVFLAGASAYKIKRAVKYPFLDFSTLEKREKALRNELRINTRTAPQLYLEVLPITREDGGAFRLGGEGRRAVEWALHMRRFEQTKLFDRMAEEGRLALSFIPVLSRVIADFHARADRFLDAGHSVRSLGAILADNEAALE